MIEMKVENILVNTTNNSRVVLLKEDTGERYLPLFIGTAEANAIAIAIENVDMPRPLTHDLAKSIIENLGASLDQVVITELKDDVFYGIMILRKSGQELRIDSRPSDCMAIALRFNAPIYVDEPVLDQAAMVIDTETGELKPVADLPGYWPAKKETDQPPEAFREVLEELDLEDDGET